MPEPGKNCLVSFSITVFLNEKSSPLSVLLSQMFQGHCFYWHTEDMQGPAMLWHKGPFSLFVFILCPVFHIWSLSFHIQSKSSPPTSGCPCHEENLNPQCNEGWIQQLTFQFFSDLILDVALQNRQFSPHSRTVWLQVQISVFSSLSSGKWGATSAKKKNCETVPIPHTPSHTKRKKKVFINLNEHIFPDICAFIYCVFLYKTYIWREAPVRTFQKHFGSTAGQLNGDGDICSFLFSVYMLMISHYYLIGQLCSSSRVVWDCLIFISCVFKASFTLSLSGFCPDSNEVHRPCCLFCNI